MKRWTAKLFAKLIPQGLAGRFVLLLLVALLSANVIALFLLNAESRRFEREAQDSRQIERVITLVAALESVDPALWPVITGETSNRSMQTRIELAPVVSASSFEPRAIAAAAALAEGLPNRIIYSAMKSRQNLRQRVLQRRDIPDSDSSSGPFALVISIQLKSNTGDHFWLNSTSAGPGREAAAGLRVLLTGLGLSLAAVLGVGLMFVRQLVGPLSALAKAAAAAANGDRAARVPIAGAREFRQAGAAFNDMQTKITRFDAERMRTLAAVGHDLRTPITSLRIRAEMLDNQSVRDDFVRTLDDMTIMANGLVQFAKSGHENEQKQSIVLAQFLTRLCQERDAELVVLKQATIVAGPVSLTRAIGNLVENAVRYAGAAKVFLDNAEGHARILVEDCGPGIAPERMEEMFEPFVRGDDSRSSETGGVGLGLSIARAIIVAQGGNIKLENKNPNGLRAIVSLPIQTGA